MSSKKEMLDKVNAAAKKREEARDRAAANKTIEAFVFEFFKEAEEVLLLDMSPQNKGVMLLLSHNTLENKIKTFDPKVKEVKIVWRGENEPIVQGVTIVWSKHFSNINQADPELYIDVAEMLFN